MRTCANLETLVGRNLDLIVSCNICGKSAFVDPMTIDLPEKTLVAELSGQIRCHYCKSDHTRVEIDEPSVQIAV